MIKLPWAVKKQPASFKLPGWFLEWLKSDPRPQGEIIMIAVMADNPKCRPPKDVVIHQELKLKRRMATRRSREIKADLDGMAGNG